LRLGCCSVDRAAAPASPAEAGRYDRRGRSVRLQADLKVALVLFTALIGTSAAAQSPNTSVKSVLAAADTYLLQYQKQLTFLLADELSNQEVVTWTRDIEARRQTSGDLFITFVPADRAWVAVHDVARVDGVPVDGREDLQRLLQHNTVTGVARLLVMRNARYNIGRVLRNFNEPTLALLVLDPRRRPQVSFERARVDGSLVTLSFKEKEPPTIVRSDGRPVYASGEIVIDAASGRVHRTSIRMAVGMIRAELTTTYARDEKLDLWLPSVFTERYAAGSFDATVTRCVSTYTNWRKFAATSRFLPVTEP
jgi:hypothetical protein